MLLEVRTNHAWDVISYLTSVNRLDANGFTWLNSNQMAHWIDIKLV